MAMRKCSNVKINREEPWYTAKKTPVGIGTEIMYIYMMRDWYTEKKRRKKNYARQETCNCEDRRSSACTTR